MDPCWWTWDASQSDVVTKLIDNYEDIMQVYPFYEILFLIKIDVSLIWFAKMGIISSYQNAWQKI